MSYDLVLCPMALSYVLWPCPMSYGPVLCPMALSYVPWVILMAVPPAEPLHEKKNDSLSWWAFGGATAERHRRTHTTTSTKRAQLGHNQPEGQRDEPMSDARHNAQRTMGKQFGGERAPRARPNGQGLRNGPNRPHPLGTALVGRARAAVPIGSGPIGPRPMRPGPGLPCIGRQWAAHAA